MQQGLRKLHSEERDKMKSKQKRIMRSPKKSKRNAGKINIRSLMMTIDYLISLILNYYAINEEDAP